MYLFNINLFIPSIFCTSIVWFSYMYNGCVGTEAMFADLGHFTASSIRVCILCPLQLHLPGLYHCLGLFIFFWY
jgi:K+ transporter